MSPEEVIGKFVSFELMIKGSKKIIEQGDSSTPEAQPVAFKVTEEKKQESTSSRLPIEIGVFGEDKGFHSTPSNYASFAVAPRHSPTLV
jgi:hypothetical protein